MDHVPRRAAWPHVVTQLGLTTWHAGRLLPSFGNIAMIAPDVNYPSGSVRRPFNESEMFTAFEIHHSTQVSLDLNSW
jgi:hypothetical protein